MDLRFGKNAVFREEFHVLLFQEIGETFGGGFQVEKSSFFRFFQPFVVIAVAVEDDPFMFGDRLFDEIVQGAGEIGCVFGNCFFVCGTGFP